MNIDLNNKINNNTVAFGRLKIKDKTLIEQRGIKKFLKSKNVKILDTHDTLELHLKPVRKGFYKFKITSLGEGLGGFIQNLKAPWLERKTVCGLPRKVINNYLEKFHPQKAIDFAIETEEARYIKHTEALNSVNKKNLKYKFKSFKE